MLILTRRIGEQIMIGDDTTVEVLGVKGTLVRMGIKAPKQLEIHREECYERIKNNTAKSPQTDERDDTFGNR